MSPRKRLRSRRRGRIFNLPRQNETKDERKAKCKRWPENNKSRNFVAKQTKINNVAITAELRAQFKYLVRLTFVADQFYFYINSDLILKEPTFKAQLPIQINV